MTTPARTARSAGLLCLALCMAGCGSLRAYDGERLPAAERAVVKADPSVSAGLPVQVILRKVDDYDVPVSKSVVELKPGRHSFLVDCRVPEAGAVTRFALEAEVAAGGSYRLVADATARGCRGVQLQ